MASSSQIIQQPHLPRFNGRNYFHWSIQMKVMFEFQDLWGIIESGVVEPENPIALTSQQTIDLNEYKKKDKKAMFLIYQTVDENIFEMISACETAKDAWEMRFKAYRGEEKVKTVRLQTLRCEFDSLKMKDTESVEEFYTRVIVLLNQMRLNGESISDRRVVEKILRSLTRKFEYVVVAIEESKDLSTLSLETLLGTLQSHELRMRQFDTNTLEHAFQTHTSWETSPSDKQKNMDPSREESSTSFKGKGREESDKKDVRTGDDKKLSVCGSGEVAVKIKNKEKKIPNVFYVPRLKHNLLSVGQLVLKGYKIVFKEESCEVYDPKGILIGKVTMTENKMFPIKFTNEDFFSLTMNIKDSSLLWHNRFGHMSLNTLAHMHKIELVKGLPAITTVNHICEGCALGKHARAAFPHDNAWRASKQLELIHSDICGPMRTPSFGESRYFLTFIDDYSRRIWTYFIKEKSEAFNCFVIFKAMVENQSECKIKTLRTDRGGEYI
ncbi:uncharacterized protein LOC112520048 [Cynara cardunculus var. scolymus]|uniref:uncharacterized protein LOC112520048 n=1 Tax=Cynara cardunculus var. scolymus TaxID=59895 RepID=UPI000D624AED|nr:uncharacterized protein LOC112520048 [Cynara cardunculus var. scolymus]